MTAGWAALLLLAATPDVGARIAASSAAAEALHGPLDGTWALTDARGQILYVLQIADPVPGEGDLEAAWRDPSARGLHSGLGVVTAITRNGQGLTLSFADDDGPVFVTLSREVQGRWSGRIDRRGRRTTVSLTRP